MIITRGHFCRSSGDGGIYLGEGISELEHFDHRKRKIEKRNETVCY